MFGDLQSTHDQQKTANYWFSEDKRLHEINKNHILQSPQIKQIPPRFEGEQSSWQRHNNQDGQYNNTSLYSSPEIQSKAIPNHQDLRKDLESTKHQSCAPLTPTDGVLSTTTPKEPPSMPKSQKSVDEPPSTPEIPDEIWLCPKNDIIARPSSPTESLQSGADSCITTSTQQNDPKHDDEQEEGEQIDQGEPTVTQLGVHDSALTTRYTLY
ncbi:hypothetical protein EV44_g3215 [Erysiphe necator]|uniref:Uncharacterized protein n=1 Tax=Uncinula necator TaxID=52586 RepID=A0A0B1P409_UNCNE|nr:hypothetical protein EV44_g3215 [Erysiphe necator]